MKTYSQFREEMNFAIDNLVSEAKGFKDEVKRRRKKKKEFLTKWEKKVKKLKDSGGTHLQGLDSRTPSTYYEDRDISSDSLRKLKVKLNDLITTLQALKERKTSTPATKKCAEDEISKIELEQYRHFSREFAMNAVDEILAGNNEQAIEKLKEALDHKVFWRIEPHLMNSGERIEKQVFSR